MEGEVGSVDCKVSDKNENESKIRLKKFATAFMKIPDEKRERTEELSPRSYLLAPWKAIDSASELRKRNVERPSGNGVAGERISRRPREHCSKS